MGIEAEALKKQVRLVYMKKVYSPKIISEGKKERQKRSPPPQSSTRGAGWIPGKRRGAGGPGTVGLGGEEPRKTDLTSLWLENKIQVAALDGPK